MKAWIPLTLLFAIGAAAHAQGTCTYPPSQDFKRYNGEMNSYLDCLKLEMDAATPKDPKKLTADEKKKSDEQQKILVQKNNDAVDELQAVVGRFNEQLKIFKAKQQKS